MLNNLPSPRPSREGTSGQHVGVGTTVVSPFDPRVKLHIDPVEFDFHIEFHPQSLPADIEDMTSYAMSKGYMCDEDDFYDCAVMVDFDTIRIYLSPVEPVRDTPLEETLPDLIQTAYGPFSGFMEAVSA